VEDHAFLYNLIIRLAVPQLVGSFMQSKLYHSQALTLQVEMLGALTLMHLEAVSLAEPGLMTLDQLEIKPKPLQLEVLLLQQQDHGALQPMETLLLDLQALMDSFNQTFHHHQLQAGVLVQH
jgi:hypothetical protein